MDIWMDGWVGGWMDGLDGWIDGWMDGWMDGWIVFSLGESRRLVKAEGEVHVLHRGTARALPEVVEACAEHRLARLGIVEDEELHGVGVGQRVRPQERPALQHPRLLHRALPASQSVGERAMDGFVRGWIPGYDSMIFFCDDGFNDPMHPQVARERRSEVSCLLGRSFVRSFV